MHNEFNLTLTREGTNVRVTVTYNAVFSAFERALAGLECSSSKEFRRSA